MRFVGTQQSRAREHGADSHLIDNATQGSAAEDIVTDFANGIAAPLPFDAWTYVNPDVSLYLDRHPDGEWVCLKARADAHPRGTGRSEARLSDRRGTIGLAVQNLVVEARPD